MSTKALTVAVSAVIGVIALVVGVMAVGAVPLGADRPHISDTAYARRTAAADKLQGRIEALATDVPPALPDVPERLTAGAAAADVAGGTGGDQQQVPQGATPSTGAVPVPQAQGRTADDGGDHAYEGEDDDRGGDHDDDRGGGHEDD